MSRSFDLLSLGLFVDAIDLGSLSAAARRHGIAQPSASESLRKLERRLGAELLVRTPRGCRPTAAGERLAVLARDVLGAADRLEAEAGAVRAGARGRIRVAASYTNAEYVLPARIARFGVSRPDVSVRLTVANSVEVADQVRDRAVEVGFIEGPLDAREFRSRVIGRDRLVVVVAPGHLWSGLADLPGEMLAATRLLLREAESGTRRAYEAACAKAGYVLAEPFGVMTSTEALKAAVRAGLGATVLSELAVGAELATGALVAVPVSGLPLTRELRAITLRTQREPLVGEFLAFLAENPSERTITVLSGP